MAAALLALAASAMAAVGVAAAANPWSYTGFPLASGSPVFALAVSPQDQNTVLAGTQSGDIYKSTNDGQSWSEVAQEGTAIWTIEASPTQPGLDLAGATGMVLRSTNGGSNWSPATGLPPGPIRAFAFTSSGIFAGTYEGVYQSIDGGATWRSDGLASYSIDALAVAANGAPPVIVAGGDESTTKVGLPLFRSSDGGNSWSTVGALPQNGGRLVSVAAAGPALPDGIVPVLIGTNTGAFLSTDGGGSWAALGSLPAEDFSGAAFNMTNANFMYLASDGGATNENGGLWRSTSNGASLSLLSSGFPSGSVTALAVGAAAQPRVYAAVWSTTSQAVYLLTWVDNGPLPSAPPPAPKLPASPKPAAHASLGGMAALLASLQRASSVLVVLAALAGLALVLALSTLAQRLGRSHRGGPTVPPDRGSQA